MIDDTWYNIIQDIVKQWNPNSMIGQPAEVGYYLAMVDKTKIINSHLGITNDSLAKYESKMKHWANAYADIMNAVSTWAEEAKSKNTRTEAENKLIEKLMSLKELGEKESREREMTQLYREFEDYMILYEMFNDDQYKIKAEEVKKKFL